MKGIRLKMMPNEVRGLCSLTRLYMEASMAKQDDIRWIHGILLGQFVEGIEKKLPYFSKEVSINIPVAILPIFIAYGNMYRQEMDSLSLLLSERICSAAATAVTADRRAMRAYESYMLCLK